MEAPVDLARVCAVTVTYGPDLTLMLSQQSSLPASCPRVVVDNGSDEAVYAQMQTALVGLQVVFLRNPSNLGLAAAQNQGAEMARGLVGDDGFLLFLDQDTEASSAAVGRLLVAYLDAERRIGPGAAGPRMVDVTTGMDHGFHVMRGWRWTRVHSCDPASPPVDCANLNASGTLVPVRYWQRSGGTDPNLFIDHVDTDWAFRMRAAGLLLHGIPGVAFAHRMGESSQRVWLFGWRVWPRRSPARHYYLFRNTLRLMRRPYVPIVWKGWAAAKLVLTVAVTFVVDERRLAQLRQMTRGLADGLPSGDALSADLP